MGQPGEIYFGGTMKNLLVPIFVGLLVFAAQADGGTQFADPLQTPANMHKGAANGALMAVAAAGARLVAAGRHGVVVYSDDNGGHWTQAAVPVQSTLVALSFPTPLEGWAVGHDGVVLSSLDGGKTWSQRLNGKTLAKLAEEHYRQALEKSPGDMQLDAAYKQAKRLVEDGPDKPLLDVWFSDRQHGYVVGAFGLIFSTSDAGASWTPLLHAVDNPSGFHFNSIRGSRHGVFIVGEQGLSLKLDPASGRFQARAFPYNGSLFGLVAHDSLLFAFGLRGRLFRSQDAGASWESLDTGVRTTINSGIYMPAGNRLALGTEGGELLLSDSGGQRFTSSPSGMAAYSVTATPSGSLAISGARGVRIMAISSATTDKNSAHD